MKALPNDPAWLKRAFSDLGLQEIVGPKHNARVLAMFKAAGHPEIHDDETAWCSAAVNAWMAEAKVDGTRKLNARSWLTWGKKLPTTKIPRGAVLVFKRGNSSWQGHVALCLDDNGDIVTCIGGNQSNSVSIARYRKTALLGARWPTPKVVALMAVPEVDELDERDIDATAPVDEPAAHIEDEPERIQPEDGAPSEPAKSMATSKIGLTQVAAGSTATVVGGAQVVSSLIDPIGDVAEQVSTVTTQTGHVIATTKSIVAVPKPGFWFGVLHVMTSPTFVACVCLIIVAACIGTWIWRRQHRKAGV